MAARRGDYDEQDRRARGTEVFVGGLTRSVTEGTLREVFSSCGEIVDVRIMKDQNGLSKGYGFVRFARREYANTAKRKKNGIEARAINFLFQYCRKFHIRCHTCQAQTLSGPPFQQIPYRTEN